MKFLSLLHFFNNRSGATAIEYGIVASLIGVGAIASVKATGETLQSTYHCITGSFTAAGCISSGDLLSSTDFNDFNVTDHRGRYDQFEDGQELANGWYVDGGTADIHDGEALRWYNDGSLNHIDLDGRTPGTISKNLNTIPGQTYVVAFDYAKHPGASSLVREFSVSGADNSATFTAEAIRSWDNGSFEFTATGSNTTVSFASQSSSGGVGALLDNIAISAK